MIKHLSNLTGKSRHLFQGLVAVLLMVLALLPVESASADDGWGTTGANINWHFYEATGELAFTGTGDMDSVAWGDYGDKVTSVTVGEGITSVCDSAFYRFKNLRTVTLASSIQTIGKSAFEDTAITQIQLPSSLRELGAYSFSGSSLTSVTIPGTVTTLKEHAFDDCTALTSVTIPGSVDTISNDAFSGCTALTSITLSEGIKTIERCAFIGARMTSIKFPSSLTSLEYKAFWDCDYLTCVEIPSSVTEVGEYCFISCDALRYAIWNASANMPSGVFSDCNKMVACRIDSKISVVRGLPSKMTAIQIPTSVTDIALPDNNLAVYSYTGTAAYNYAGTHSNVTFMDMSTSEGATAWNNIWASATSAAASATTTTAAPTATASPSPNATATATPTQTPTTKVTVDRVKKVKVKTKKSRSGKYWTVTWKSVANASGYQVYYSTRKNGGYKKWGYDTYTNKKVLYSGKKKKYYFKVRAYRTVDYQAVYGKFSKPVRK